MVAVWKAFSLLGDIRLLYFRENKIKKCERNYHSQDNDENCIIENIKNQKVKSSSSETHIKQQIFWYKTNWKKLP